MTPSAGLLADLAAKLEVETEDPFARFELAAWRSLARDQVTLTRTGTPAHFTASALPITPDARRVCLVLHGRIGLWVQPGGHFEPGDDSVPAAAARELAEETGLVAIVDPAPLSLSRHEAPCGSGTWHLDVQFLATVSESAPVVSNESRDVAWFDVEHLPMQLASGVDGLVAAGVSRIRSNDPRRGITRHAPATPLTRVVIPTSPAVSP